MKKIKILFISLSMLLCAIPLFGMTFRPTLETTENRRLSEFPKLIKDDGSINLSFFSNFETYFTEHFAFRNELVATDGKIQGGVFRTSANNSVIYGKDDWLYYTSTISDYSGKNMMNERELKNLQRNLSIINEYLKEKKIEFILTIPPNKNTLYGKYMPYYASTKVSDDHTLYKLKDLCTEANIEYADLYEVLKNESETVYLKRDSHWNNKGALIAYQTILDKLGREYNNYESITPNRSKSENGDLNKMLYSYYGDKEVNYYYDIPQEYEYVSDTQSVEDGWIETTVENKESTLLMFRDSFGNTLIPLIANQFGHAYFTKESPYRLEKVVSEQSPNIVIFEKVERNLRDFINNPPIISSPVISEELDINENYGESVSDITVTTNMFDPNFYELKGNVNKELISNDSDIILKVNDIYIDAYETKETEFMAYLPKNMYVSNTISIEVLLKDGDTIDAIFKKDIDKGE